MLKGGIGAAVAGGVFATVPTLATLATPRAGASKRARRRQQPARLGSDAIPVSSDDVVHVPAG